MIWYKSLSEDLVEILASSSLTGPGMKILQTPRLVEVLICELLWDALGGFLILYDPLQQQQALL